MSLAFSISSGCNNIPEISNKLPLPTLHSTPPLPLANEEVLRHSCVALPPTLGPGRQKSASCSTESTNTPFAAFMGVKGGVHKRSAGLTLL